MYPFKTQRGIRCMASFQVALPEKTTVDIYNWKLIHFECNLNANDFFVYELFIQVNFPSLQLSCICLSH